MSMFPMLHYINNDAFYIKNIFQTFQNIEFSKDAKLKLNIGLIKCKVQILLESAIYYILKLIKLKLQAQFN